MKGITIITLLAATIAVATASTPRTSYAQVANDCVNVRYTSRIAFFKAQMTNLCNKTVWVAYCMLKDCGRTPNHYYTSAVTLSPGESEPVDTEGQGIHKAACVYEAPDWDTPKRLSTGHHILCD